MPEDPCQTLITTYHELNAAIVDELDHQPSALEFLRYVAKNRPFVVRGSAKHWDAVTKWDADYLRTVLKGHAVRVAVTPRGNADAVVQDAHGRLIFAEPHEIHEPFEDFLDYVQGDSKSPAAGRNVKYAQPQNDSLRQEYGPLIPDVPSHLAFANEALEKEVDACNFWLGNARSSTSLHKDNYENIYVQIRGKKLFTLLAPVEMPCVNESPIQFGRYAPSSKDEDSLEVHMNAGDEPIPVPLWDPDEPEARSTQYSKFSSPLRVTLDEGDMMYLPAMWYHKVGQIDGDEGFVCSVNYWYDMEFGGSFWSQNAFVRDVFNSTLQNVQYPVLDMVEEQARQDSRGPFST